MEVLPESTYITGTTEKSSDKNQRRQLSSYWEKAFQLADLPVISEDKSGLDINKQMVSLKWPILDDDGLPKFPLIAWLFKTAPSLSHGNSAPKNGFSINKYILKLHENSISPDTVDALRFVQDTILSLDGKYSNNESVTSVI